MFPVTVDRQGSRRAARAGSWLRLFAMCRTPLVVLLALWPILAAGLAALHESHEEEHVSWRHIRDGAFLKDTRRALLALPAEVGKNDDSELADLEFLADAVTDRSKRSSDDDDGSGSGLGAIFRRLMRDLVTWLGSLLGLRSGYSSGGVSTTPWPATGTETPDVEEFASDGP